MKKLILFPILLMLSACSYSNMHLMPNHFGIKPSYELDTCQEHESVNKYKVETSLDWNL